MRSTVLVVDDSETDRLIFERYLTQAHQNYEVISYADPATLTSILKMVQVDCVILDFNLAGETSIQHIATIHKISPYTGIIMITGVGDEKIAATAFKSGVDDYLSKNDISQSRLSAVVSNVIAKKRIEKEHHNANAELTLLRSVMDNTPNLNMVCDPETSLFITFNLALNRFLKLPTEHIKSKSYFHISNQFDTTDDWFQFVEQVKAAGHLKFETELVNADGQAIPFEFDCCYAQVGEKHYLLFSGMDISRLKNVQQELIELATKDPLTQLRNRRGLSEEYARLYKTARRNSQYLCIAIFDLDNFKQINDSHGHDVGDTVLVQFAELLKANFQRPLDYIARAGGEEFVVILSDESAKSIQQLIDKVIKVCPENLAYQTTASVGGVCIYAKSVKLAYEQQFKIADNNLYYAKEHGKNQARITYEEYVS
ncbi:response regulator/sensory box/GGDEF domain/EAL domain-containing protein [Catenovulum agarivorans DS-2]|uniref:diguanylate cyclase n=1 Tax=Catenovulum agarivorans DS-2 TaxID=1328313 RepID=W7QED7_9ALTE|nr:diguanylate cyclase [Catenovulum agarivorans]EWH11249.1 response regulator/sensory box/GGDEF domain/EAL domain-containing protein [Catenovulum agarivorans DS-2]